MKKGIVFILISVLCISLFGCSSQAVNTESIVESVKESVLSSVSESLRESSESSEAIEETTPETTSEPTTQATQTTETTVDPVARKEFLRSSVITVESISMSEPNTAGGVDVSFTIKNQSSEEIKYVFLSLNFYNRVGDIVSTEIGLDDTFSLQLTGPVAPGDKAGTDVDEMYWQNVIYNSTADSLKIVQIQIEYMNGDSLTLNSDEALMVMPEA